MVGKLSDIIADFYVKKNIIDTKEKDAYRFGIELILNDIFTFSMIILISAFLFHVRYAVEFLIVFCCTRIYCGGYHAPKSYLDNMRYVFLYGINLTTHEYIIYDPVGGQTVTVSANTLHTGGYNGNLDLRFTGVVIE